DRITRLVRSSWNSMVSFARKFAPDGEEAIAEEIVQDALLAVWEQRVELAAEELAARAIVMQRIKHLGLNRRRRERLRRPEAFDRDDPESPSDGAEVWTAASRVQVRQDLMAAMDKLTPAQRAVMELHGIEGGTFEQVARYRRCSTKTVKEL